MRQTRTEASERPANPLVPIQLKRVLTPPISREDQMHRVLTGVAVNWRVLILPQMQVGQ